MLKPENRLKERFEFNVARKYGEQVRSPYFFLFILNAKNYDGPPKIGVVVSTKVHKKATKRNKIKRLFNENIRKTITKYKRGYWIVFQPTQSSLDADYETLNTEINKAVSKVFGSN